MLEARVRRKHKEGCQTRHLENPKGRTRRGERGVQQTGADQGQPAARAARRARSRIPAVLVRKPWASHRRKGCQSVHGARGAECHLLSPGHRLAKALSFLPGVHLLVSRRHVVQIGLQTIWIPFICNSKARCHSRRERAKLSSWCSWQLSVTCRFCDPPPARVSEGPLFSLDFLLLFV